MQRKRFSVYHIEAPTLICLLPHTSTHSIIILTLTCIINETNQSTPSYWNIPKLLLVSGNLLSDLLMSPLEAQKSFNGIELNNGFENESLKGKSYLIRTGELQIW
ncbi:hypothetical protein AB6A40_003201 [Gnathostoma spinigerum]|uniref:Uncharacterized protein n=1 Tax=Gnathostoma spinigerum TaxID=75299 RepID=A0ABD6EIU4_9BILA